MAKYMLQLRITRYNEPEPESVIQSEIIATAYSPVGMDIPLQRLLKQLPTLPQDSIIMTSLINALTALIREI